MIQKYFGKRLVYDTRKKICVYYQDRDKRWKFFTGERGFRLLLVCLKNVEKFHERYLASYQIDRKLGLSIYVDKKKNITWSDEDYRIPDFRFVYITFKSFQRFTEMYSLLERFSRYYAFGKKKINVLSVGCGPGFECLAFERYARGDRVRFYGIDVIEEWGDDFESHGENYSFIGKKIIGNSKLKRIQNVEFVILSNVFANHMMNASGFEVVRYLMNDLGVKFVLVNDRPRRVDITDLDETNSINFNPLISESDHRQFFLTKINFKLKKKQKMNHIFPNVPFVK